jgi:hypothetical protein
VVRIQRWYKGKRLKRVFSTILDQAKKNHRNRTHDFYLEFVGDLEAKKEKER